jgi:hypothetical protein
MSFIECPQCHKRASFGAACGAAANDDETHIAFVPPDGFRKVQLGWRSSEVQLFCVDCGVAVLTEGADVSAAPPI